MAQINVLPSGFIKVTLNPDSKDELVVTDEIREAVKAGEFQDLLEKVEVEFATAVDDCFEHDLPVVVKSRLEALQRRLEDFWT